MRVFVTRRIPRIGIDLLERRKYDVKVWEEDEPIRKDKLIEELRESDALLTILSDKIDGEILERGEKLKIVSNYAVGFDNIDIERASELGIAVTNTPDILTNATAELTWALILSVARRIVEADRFVREGKFKGWEPKLFLGMELFGKTLGIIGAGRIGTAVGLKSRCFGMRILYFSPRQNRTLDEIGGRKVPLKELLEESDIITLHVPLKKNTLHMIGEKELKAMKKESILINVSRGAVVDEVSLLKALREGWIRGAGLDVYEKEPEVPSELRKLPNVVLLPHIGSATEDARKGMARIASLNIIAALEGRQPPNIVNLDQMKKLGVIPRYKK